MKDEFKSGEFVKAKNKYQGIYGIVIRERNTMQVDVLTGKDDVSIFCKRDIERLNPVLDAEICTTIRNELTEPFKKLMERMSRELEKYCEYAREREKLGKAILDACEQSDNLRFVSIMNPQGQCFSDGRDLEKEYEQQVKEEIAENANCKPDMVNHPPHYCQKDGLECIDVMQLMFGKKAVIDYCRCNIFKYRFRAEHKNGDEDIKKAQWYENKLNELLGAGFTIKGKA